MACLPQVFDVITLCLLLSQMLPCVGSEWTGPTFFLMNTNGIIYFNCEDLCSQGKERAHFGLLHNA